MIQLQVPIKVIPSEFYSLVVEDATGTNHFWLLDGTYDGWDMSFSEDDNGL